MWDILIKKSISELCFVNCYTVLSFMATQRVNTAMICTGRLTWDVQLKVGGQIAFTSSQAWDNFSCLIILKACIKRNTLVINARVPLAACATHETSMIISKRASFKGAIWGMQVTLRYVLLFLFPFFLLTSSTATFPLSSKFISAVNTEKERTFRIKRQM